MNGNGSQSPTLLAAYRLGDGVKSAGLALENLVTHVGRWCMGIPDTTERETQPSRQSGWAKLWNRLPGNLQEALCAVRVAVRGGGAEGLCPTRPLGNPSFFLSGKWRTWRIIWETQGPCRCHFCPYPMSSPDSPAVCPGAQGNRIW